MSGRASDCAPSNIRSMEVQDAPTRLPSPDDERPPGGHGPCSCVERDDGKAVPGLLDVDRFRHEVHVLGPRRVLPQIPEDRGERAANGLSTHDFRCDGIERKEGRGIGIQEVRHGGVSGMTRARGYALRLRIRGLNRLSSARATKSDQRRVASDTAARTSKLTGSLGWTSGGSSTVHSPGRS